MICDSWREDINTFEIVNGAIEAARRIRGLKIHLYAMETMKGTDQLPPVWKLLTGELQKYGALGMIWSRQQDFQRTYRAMDFVLTPHRIVTRVTGEALATGTPVLAANGCKATSYTADVFDPDDVADVAERLVDDLRERPDQVRQICAGMASRFSLGAFGQAIEPVYQEAVGGAS